MLKKTLITTLLAFSALHTGAHANEIEVKKAIEARLGTKVESVSKAGYLGLYEVYLDGQILYTDDKGSAFIACNLVDTKTMRSVAKDMQSLNNVTIYTFIYPILSEDSLKKSKQIWCSADRARVWNDWLIEGKAPSGREDCDTTAIQKTVELGRHLNINGTPTLFFADGERIPGAVPVSHIEQKLAAQAPAK